MVIAATSGRAHHGRGFRLAGTVTGAETSCQFCQFFVSREVARAPETMHWFCAAVARSPIGERGEPQESYFCIQWLLCSAVCLHSLGMRLTPGFCSREMRSQQYSAHFSQAVCSDVAWSLPLREVAPGHASASQSLPCQCSLACARGVAPADGDRVAAPGEGFVCGPWDRNCVRGVAGWLAHLPARLTNHSSRRRAEIVR